MGKQDYDEIVLDEDKHAVYTGLPSIATFAFLLRILAVAGFTPFRQLSVKNTLLVLLLKLKLGLKNRDIAYRMGISYTHISSILSRRLTILASACETLIRWPSREAVITNMSNCFRSASTTIRRTCLVVDCFELHTERPKALTPRAQMWSNYKSHSTVKFLVGISPMGSVSFLS